MARASVMSSPPRRRVTRSASREIEAANPKGIQSHTSRTSVDDRRRVQSKGKVLEAVTEESPAKSPRKSTSRFSSHGAADYHEDVANLTGTTILPSEPETDLGNGSSETMLDVLPDLERAAKKVLDILVPASKDAVSIINMGKKLAGPKNAQNHRFIHAVSKLASETKVFAARSTYIDVQQIHRLLYSLLANSDGFADWSPDAVLHKANCAYFAREMLLATDATAMRSAVRDVEAMFPAAFMNDVTRGGAGERTPGDSALEKDTFELALEIRTQALIIRLEDRQDESGFDAIAMLKDAFFLEDPGDVLEANDAPLRGFGLDSLGGVDGYLPARFREAAFDRYNDLLLQLPEDPSGELDIPDLKAAFRWQKFVYRSVNWVRKRGDEINRDLKDQQSPEDVRDAFFSMKDTFDGGMETSQLVEENLEGPSVRETPPEEDREEPPPAPKPVPEPKEKRPKPSRSSFLNENTIERLMQRQRESRAPTEKPESRRKSDLPGPSNTRDRTSPEKRRQTLPAPSQPRPTTPPRVEEPPREDSPLFLRDEDELQLDNDSDINETSRLSLEKSQSPRMTRTRPVISSQPTPTASRRIHLSTSELWRRANHTPAPQDAAARKKTFIDRQDNARRVSPISQASVRRDEHREERRHRLMEFSRKRRRAEEQSDDDDNDDDQFSRIERAVDIKRRRAEKPDQSHKRARVDETTFDYDADAPTQQLQSGLEEFAGRGTSRTPAVDKPPASTAPAVITTSDRKSWTPAEDERLIRLIKEFGPKWAQIERQNEVMPEKPGERRFVDRNQGQLKDRARNIQMKYLRERRPLPPNFEKVTMKAADRTKLMKRGISIPDPKAE